MNALLSQCSQIEGPILQPLSFSEVVVAGASSGEVFLGSRHLLRQICRQEGHLVDKRLN